MASGPKAPAPPHQCGFHLRFWGYRDFFLRKHHSRGVARRRAAAGEALGNRHSRGSRRSRRLRRRADGPDGRFRVSVQVTTPPHHVAKQSSAYLVSNGLWMAMLLFSGASRAVQQPAKANRAFNGCARAYVNNAGAQQAGV